MSAIRAGSENTTWKYGTGNSSASRSASHSRAGRPLTLRAMAVAARVIGDLRVGTVLVLAAGDMAAERCRAAVLFLSRLFRRLVLEKLDAAHGAGALQFFGKHASLANARAFAAYLAPLRNSEWVVYSKRPFGGPKDVLRSRARYPHRVAISNRRLVSLGDEGVTFKWKDYRIEGPERYKVMTLDTHEFIRRFLIHVLPQGFHRIRYYGLLTSQTRAKNIARARELLAVPLIPIDAIQAASATPEEPKPEHPCPCCGSPMLIIETFLRGQQPNASRSPQHRPTPVPPAIRIDTS